jgi:hypothetical protein
VEEITRVTHKDLSLWQQQTAIFTQQVLAFLITKPEGTTEHQLLTHLRALDHLCYQNTALQITCLYLGVIFGYFMCCMY